MLVPGKVKPSIHRTLDLDIFHAPPEKIQFIDWWIIGGSTVDNPKKKLGGYSISKKSTPLDEHHDYIEKTVSKRFWQNEHPDLCMAVAKKKMMRCGARRYPIQKVRWNFCSPKGPIWFMWGRSKSIKPMSCSMTSVFPNMCAKEPFQSDFGDLSRIYEAERNSFQFPVLEGSKLPTSLGLGWGVP